MNAFTFFFEHAGYSYDPATESAFAGRVRCALSMARDEARADEFALVVNWEQDDITNRDHEEITEDVPEYYLWHAFIRRDGRTLASLGGIDFGYGRGPGTGETYTRVVECELYGEALAEIDRTAEQDARTFSVTISFQTAEVISDEARDALTADLIAQVESIEDGTHASYTLLAPVVAN